MKNYFMYFWKHWKWVILTCLLLPVFAAFFVKYILEAILLGSLTLMIILFAGLVALFDYLSMRKIGLFEKQNRNLRHTVKSETEMLGIRTYAGDLIVLDNGIYWVKLNNNYPAQLGDFRIFNDTSNSVL